MQSPLAAAFMRKREPVASFDRWTLLRIKDFVDVDSAGLQPNGPEDVRFNAKSIAWNTKQAVQIIEIDPKLEMLFDDVLDANRRLHLQPCGLGILRKQAAARHRRLQRLDWCHDRTVAGGPPPNGKEHPRLADTQPAAFP